MGYYDEISEPDINEGLEEMACFDDAVLIDVRTPDEYREGHVPGAVNIEAGSLKRRNRKWVESVLKDKDAHVFMYCYSGSRSGISAGALRQMGYLRAKNIGGYMDYDGPVSTEERYVNDGGEGNGEI